MSRGLLFDLARVVLWLLLTPVAYFAGWLNSVAFVSILSVWALVESAWSAFRANEESRLARIEGKLDKLLGEES